ncbi:MAG: hypothetical protein HC804_01820 [Anaerolineae bacterium]|nr:hypothetical protein [Anaerolineae bacterium]
MITITGKGQMTFMLPTAVDTAFDFYQDIHRVLPYLPRIRLIHGHGAQHVRVCYLSRELNMYDVEIYCDIQAETNREEHVIRLLPREAEPPVKAKSSFHAASAYGRYSSTSTFFAEGNQTRLEYHLELSAELPKPWAVKFLPDGMMDSIANNITNHRIQEIATGFITQSALHITAWAAQNGSG